MAEDNFQLLALSASAIYCLSVEKMRRSLTPESDGQSRKRKTIDTARCHSSTKRRAVASVPFEKVEKQIHELEDEIALTDGSPNNIAILLSMFDLQRPDEPINVILALTLCRVFSRLIAAGCVSDATSISKDDPAPRKWHMQEKYAEYQNSMVKLLQSGGPSMQITALRLIMRILKEEAQHLDNSLWASSTFKDLLTAILTMRDGGHVRSTYVEEFMNRFRDCAYYILDFLA